MNRPLLTAAAVLLCSGAVLFVAADASAVDVTYKGWNAKCIGCPLIQSSYDGLTLVAGKIYTNTVGVITRIVQLGLAAYIAFTLYQMTLGKMPETGGKGDFTVVLMKNMAVFLFFFNSGIFGYELIYNAIYKYVIAGGAQIAYSALDAAFKVSGAGGLFPASVFNIAAPTCNAATNAGGYMACMVHLSEAALGFIPEMFWQDLTAFRFTTLTFWIALLMFRQTLEPFFQVTKDIIIGFLGGTMALVIAPVGLGLWLIPVTSRIGVALIGQFIHSSLLLAFLAVATIAIMVMSYAGLAVALQQPESMSLGDGVSAVLSTTPWNFADRLQQARATAAACQAGNDHYSCVVSLARSGKLNLNPDSPLLWIILILLRVAGSVYSEAAENARYYRDKFVGG